MMLLITCLAYLQILKNSICMFANKVRRRWILPFAVAAGRDMFLLKNGAWIDASDRIPLSMIALRYDADTHTLTTSMHLTGSKTVRLSWLSVMADGEDMSDFFNSLRISEKSTISDKDRIMLFGHQKGWLPTGNVEIIIRSGDREKLSPFD